MGIDWHLVARIGAPLAAGVLTFLLTKFLQDRPRLVTYYGHASAHQMKPTEANPEGITVHTHSVVVRNAGRKAATNVRVSHAILPQDFNVFPAVHYSVEKTPENTSDIVFPKLVPKEQVTISYLYFAPVIFHQTTSGVKSDEGFARVLEVLPTPQPAKWVVIAFYTSCILGLFSLCYLTVVLVRLVV
jgi:hypothetical protein